MVFAISDAQKSIDFKIFVCKIFVWQSIALKKIMSSNLQYCSSFHFYISFSNWDISCQQALRLISKCSNPNFIYLLSGYGLTDFKIWLKLHVIKCISEGY